MKNIFLSLSILTLFFASCKQCETRICEQNEDINIKLINYASAEADSFMVRLYPQGSSFNWITDSVLLLSNGMNGDTVFLISVNSRTRPLYLSSTTYNYDLEIENISDHKTIRVSNIQNEQSIVEYCHSPFVKTKKLTECRNPISGFNYSVSSGSIDVIGNNILIYK